MDSQTSLLTLYEKWRLLTGSESDAVRARDWARLVECQAAKQTLAQEIAAARPAASGSDSASRLIITELISMEQQNADALASAIEEARAEHQSLRKTGQKLRQLHRAYAPGAAPLWHSYS